VELAHLNVRIVELAHLNVPDDNPDMRVKTTRLVAIDTKCDNRELVSAASRVCEFDKNIPVRSSYLNFPGKVLQLVAPYCTNTRLVCVFLEWRTISCRDIVRFVFACTKARAKHTQHKKHSFVSAGSDNA
jgi:hypothetical protein